MRSKSPVYPFIIVLRNKQQKGLRLTGLLLACIAIAFFAYRTYLPDGSGLNWLAAGTVALLLVWTLWEMRQGKTTRFRPILLVTAGGLAIFPPHSLFALFFLLLAWLEKEAWAAQEIGFADDHILFNGLWPRKLLWSELNNVVLKDGLLTLDFKNNKLFQKETDNLDDEEYDGEEDEFNDFCRRQLQAPRPSPQK